MGGPERSLWSELGAKGWGELGESGCSQSDLTAVARSLYLMLNVTLSCGTAPAGGGVI